MTQQGGGAAKQDEADEVGGNTWGGVSQRGGGVSVMFFCSSLSCSVAVLPCRLQVAWLVCWQAGGLVDQLGALGSRATSSGGRGGGRFSERGGVEGGAPVAGAP